MVENAHYGTLTETPETHAKAAQVAGALGLVTLQLIPEPRAEGVSRLPANRRHIPELAVGNSQ